MTLIIGICCLGGAVLIALLSRRTATSTDTASAPSTLVESMVPKGLNLHQAELESHGIVDRVIVPAFSTLGNRVAKLLPPERVNKFRHKVVLAGLQGSWKTEKIFALKAFGSVLGGAGGFLAFVAMGGLSGIALGAIVAFIGWYGTDFYLDRTARARQQDIEHALPDILDQITICAEAGLGLDAAIHRAVRSNDNALIDELGRTLQDVRLGLPRSAALEKLMERTDVSELRLFVRAMIQADKTGAPIAKVLRVQSDEVREKRRQAAEERAMKLPVMLIVPLVLCILPALFIVIMGPAAIRLVSEGAV